jgi:hypothetical protein
MITTIPLTPFPRKGVTTVQPLCGFRFIDSLPPRGGPSEAAS